MSPGDAQPLLPCNMSFPCPQATRNPFYLHVGREVLHSLNNLTQTECGYATVHSVIDGSLEDRMESFFLSETCKYLYLVSGRAASTCTW